MRTWIFGTAYFNPKKSSVRYYKFLLTDIINFINWNKSKGLINNPQYKI